MSTSGHGRGKQKTRQHRIHNIIHTFSTAECQYYYFGRFRPPPDNKSLSVLSRTRRLMLLFTVLGGSKPQPSRSREKKKKILSCARVKVRQCENESLIAGRAARPPHCRGDTTIVNIARGQLFQRYHDSDYRGPLSSS